MEWSNELVLELISLYEKNPIIWNPTEPDHKNRIKLNDAWLAIESHLSVQVPLCEIKKKTDSLRASYRTLRKKVAQTTGTAKGAKDVYKPTWFAYDALDRFLRATAKIISTLSSEQVPYGAESTEEIMDESMGEERAAVDTEDQSPSCGGANNRPSASNVGKRRQTHQVDNEVRKHLKQATDALQTRRRVNFMKCKSIYNEDMDRKIKFIMQKNRADPFPGSQ